MNFTDKIDMLRSALRKDASSSGGTIYSGLGLNAINLETQAKSLIPYNAPFLNSTARTQSDVGGTTVQWKAVLKASPGWVTLPEGQRNQTATLLEKDYSAPFKSNGIDADVSFFAQETGRGFQDNLGFAQFSALQMYLRAQDQQLLCDGNSGPSSDGGGNGYALGTCPAPVATLISNSIEAGTIPQSTNVSAYAVLLTPFGLRAQADSSINANYPTGLSPQLSANNAVGTAITASGGTSIISAASNVVVTTSTSQTVLFTISNPTASDNLELPFGAVGFALYVNSTDSSNPTKANSKFAGIFNGSSVYLTALPSGSNQAATETGLTTDYSYDNNAVDSYYAWAVNWSSQGVSPTGNYAGYEAYFADLGGSTLTAVGDGSISQFSTIASYLYNNYKSAPDRILIASQTASGGNLKEEIQKAILSGTSGPGQSSASRLIFESVNGVISGGTKQLAYEWPFTYDGISKVITIEVMPWLQPGMIVFETTANPYPQAAGRIPAAFEVHDLLGTFSIMWPVTNLTRGMGVYGFLATKNYIPHVAAVLQNVG
jgi:hypothetical protein